MKKNLAGTLFAVLFFLNVHPASAESSAGKTFTVGNGNTVRIDELRRTKDNTVMLKLTFTFATPDKIETRNKYLGLDSLTAVKFLDLGGRKIYGCLQPQYSNRCYGSKWEQGSPVTGDSVSYWAQMTAPPSDVNTVSLTFADEPPIDGITIDPVK